MGDDSWLVIGLGNPGPGYAGNRHNVGQMVLAELAHRMSASFKSHKANARVAEGRVAPGEPKLILAMIAGGMTQIFINLAFSSGLRAPAAPGSIIAVLIATPGGSYVGVILSVIGGAAASFVVAALLLKTDKAADEGDLSAATANMESMKGKKSIASSTLGGTAAGTATLGRIRPGQ